MLRWLRMNGIMAVSVFSAALLGACTYGPEEDRSRFDGAVLLSRDRILFSFQITRYRPPTGLSTFPDGGIGTYTDDENVLGVFDRSTGSITIERRESNTDWEPDQGHFGFPAARASLAIIARSGLRSDAYRVVTELVDADTRISRPFPVNDALARRGLFYREIYLVSPNGHTLFITTDSSASAGNGPRDLWMRYPDDAYRLVGHVVERQNYYGLRGTELIYWVPSPREFRAYDIYSMQTRTIADPRTPGTDQVAGGEFESEVVRVTPTAVELGRRAGYDWAYEPTGLTIDAVRRALRSP